MQRTPHPAHIPLHPSITRRPPLPLRTFQTPPTSPWRAQSTPIRSPNTCNSPGNRGSTSNLPIERGRGELRASLQAHRRARGPASLVILLAKLGRVEAAQRAPYPAAGSGLCNPLGNNLSPPPPSRVPGALSLLGPLH